MSDQLSCRLCSAKLTTTFVDLGVMPLANAYLRAEQLAFEEPRYSLHARVCDSCLLVQLESLVSPDELFSDYAYFSSYSDSWVEHARRFAQRAMGELQLGPESLVVEVASNDGYLLRHFVAAGVGTLGIEPAGNVARVAVEAGIPTECVFFGRETARRLAAEGRQADLLVANNVLAHVPDLNDFVAGLALAVKPEGVISIEVPHILNLIVEVQFDTIYHEHFSYFSLLTIERALRAHGLEVVDIEQLQTHGGSLRVWVSPAGAGRTPSPGVAKVRSLEQEAGLHDIATYTAFPERVERCRAGLVEFLESAAAAGSTVVAYGAAAKGNTLLNYCGVTQREIAYVVDRSPIKQGRYLPGTHLPIQPPERVFETRPDYLVILPWNLKDEIEAQMKAIDTWGGKFVTLVPEVRIET